EDLLAPSRWRAWLAAPAAGAALIALAIITIHQLPVWKNTDNLFQHTLTVTGRNVFVNSYYADYLYFQGRLEESLAQLEMAAAAMPGDPLARYKRGCILMEQHRNYDAQQEFEKVIAIDPND